jgi:hypothetical protein
MTFIPSDADPQSCGCATCSAGQPSETHRPGEPPAAEASAPRVVPTSAPEYGQLPDVPREPVDVLSMSQAERLERAWLLTAQGGAAGSAERLAHLNNRPDFTPSL